MKHNRYVFLCFSFLIVSVLINSVGALTYEDFTIFDESDANNRYDVINSTFLNITDLNRIDDAHYISDDYGDSFFMDFEHDVDFMIDETTDIGTSIIVGNIWGVSNYQNDDYYLYDYRSVNPSFVLDVMCSITNGKYLLRLIQEHSVFKTDDSILLDEDTVYFLKIIRSGISYIRVGIYSTNILRNAGNALNGDIDNLVINSIVSNSFRYVYASNSGGSTNNRTMSGFVRNLYIHLHAVTFYFNHGGTLKINGATTANGTVQKYVNASVIELGSLPTNSSFIFSYFNFDSTNATTNPHNLTVTSDLTVWTYFGVPAGGYAGFSYLFFGLLLGVVVGSLVLIKKLD